jgi:hypothetical protein
MRERSGEPPEIVARAHLLLFYSVGLTRYTNDPYGIG